MDDKLKEYEMLRKEILQYVEKYQVVRNMMYLLTVTILGFCINKENINAYSFLILLVVIVPSYLVIYDYWLCVLKIITYLIVFFEDEKDFPIKWEKRKRIFDNKMGFSFKRDFQTLPYFVCALTCLGLYFLNINYKNIVEILVGVISGFSCMSIVLQHLGTNIRVDKFIDSWKNIKQLGENN